MDQGAIEAVRLEVEELELTILMPCLDEAQTIVACIAEARARRC